MLAQGLHDGGGLGHAGHEVHPRPARAAGIQEQRADATGSLRRQPVHRQPDGAGLGVPVVQRDGVLSRIAAALSSSHVLH